MINNLEYLEVIQYPVIISQESLNYILANIKFNYLLILFTMGCFSSLLYCNSKPNKKRNIITPTYEVAQYVESQPILAKI